MTRVYNQSAISSIYVGPTGHSHTKVGEGPMAVDCAICEPFLVREGWVYRRDDAPLSDAEQREKERIEREGSLAVKQSAESLARVATEMSQRASAPESTVPDPARRARQGGR